MEELKNEEVNFFSWKPLFSFPTIIIHALPKDNTSLKGFKNKIRIGVPIQWRTDSKASVLYENEKMD